MSNFQYYEKDGKQYDRVTAISGMLAKPWLCGFYGKYGTKLAKEISEEGMKWGTEGHRILNHLITDEISKTIHIPPYLQFPPELHLPMLGFGQFKGDVRPIFKKTEMTVYSMLGFAGTLDTVAEIMNKQIQVAFPVRTVTLDGLGIIDWKIAKNLDRVAVMLQLAAYWAGHREMFPKEIINWAMGVRLKKEKAKIQYQVVVVENLSEAFDMFLNLYQVYKWMRGRK